MKLPRSDLKKVLMESDLGYEALKDLLDEAVREQVERQAHEKALRSRDSLGVIRLFTDDCGHSVMWVRVAGKQWEPWFRDTHGNDAEDHEIPWQKYPVVGKMPKDWVTEQQEYEKDYEDDD